MSVLVFSKTERFRHLSIADGLEAIASLGARSGFDVDATEDASVFTSEDLQRYGAIVWLSTTGNVLTEEEQAGFESYVRGGGGYVGIHAAADTHYDWPWYGALVGAYFSWHPDEVQPARILVEDCNHPSTSHLPESWDRVDEWYNFRANPRPRVRVLASLDETTYTGGDMGPDHPIAWCQDFGGGRSWYTAGGHTPESFREPQFVEHLLGGIVWAARSKP